MKNGKAWLLTFLLGLCLPVLLGMSEDDALLLGRSFVTKPWVAAPAATRARDGLGPLSNGASCVSCHKDFGDGGQVQTSGPLLPFYITKLTHPTGDPHYGEQLSPLGTLTVPSEGRVTVYYHENGVSYRDGSQSLLRSPRYVLGSLNYGPLAQETKLSIRRTPSLRGMAIIDAIPDSWLLKQASLGRGKSYEGRPRRLWNPKTKSYNLGKFGWKAGSANLMGQVALALHADMGLTTPIFPEDNCAKQQLQCQTETKGQDLDVPLLRLKAMTSFVKSLLPEPSQLDLREGSSQFQRVGCNSCHVSQEWQYQGSSFRPYSDFLLHDMGDGLADGNPPHQILEKQWRTAPLWGIKNSAALLHDGRARTVEEAILWHGGQGAASRDKFLALSSQQRKHLIRFVESL